MLKVSLAARGIHFPPSENCPVFFRKNPNPNVVIESCILSLSIGIRKHRSGSGSGSGTQMARSGLRKRDFCCMAADCNEGGEGFREEEELSEVLNPDLSPPCDDETASSFHQKPLSDDEHGSILEAQANSSGVMKFGKTSNNGLSDRGLDPKKKRRKCCKGKGKGVTKPPQRDNDLHRLLFLPNGLAEKTHLAYCVNGQKMLKGLKQGNGILCSCCNSQISPSQFEAHAGWGGRRKPYHHIYTTTCDGLLNKTLHDISISLAKNGQTGVPIAAREAPPAPEFGTAFQLGGCAICKAHDFCSSKFEDRTIIICDQCQKEFHVGCLRDCGLCHLKQVPKGDWFCNDCYKIQLALQNSIDNGAQMIPASILKTVLKKKHNGDSFQWQILGRKHRTIEHLRRLSRANELFNKCFDPIVAGSGPNLIPAMVYGRETPGQQQFAGMHCVVLMVNSVVVSAGLVRSFGREVAELPLVATSKEHQGKGYFQVLFWCIERLLCSLNVENMVLPAAEKAEPFWTQKLGFRRMNEDRLLDYTTRYLHLTSFKGTSMLDKKVERKTQ